MKTLDVQERLVVRELIKNPRMSDNQISKETGVPVMTVNRKRKLLERESLLRYFTSLDTGVDGTGRYKAKQAYILKLNFGITRNQFIDKVEKDRKFQEFSSRFISLSYLGEKDGNLSYLVILDGISDSQILDEFHATLIPFLKSKFGEECIKEILTMRITNTLRRHHNYTPLLNMEHGIIKKDWPNEYIFVDGS